MNITKSKLINITFVASISKTTIKKIKNKINYRLRWTVWFFVTLLTWMCSLSSGLTYTDTNQPHSATIVCQFLDSSIQRQSMTKQKTKWRWEPDGATRKNVKLTTWENDPDNSWHMISTDRTSFRLFSNGFSTFLPCVCMPGSAVTNSQPACYPDKIPLSRQNQANSI